MLRTEDGVRRQARTRWSVTMVMMVALSLWLAATDAQAQQPMARSEAAAIPDNPPPREPLGISVSLGTRSDLVRSGGLDPFSRTDRVGQSALGVGYRFGGLDAAGLSLGFEWDHGTASATARSAPTTLTVDRLSVALEARYPLVPRLSAFGRLAPGLIRDQVTLVDSSAPVPAYQLGATDKLEQTTWTPAADVGAGLSFRVVDVRGRGVPAFSFWVIADGGFGFAPAHDLSLRSGSEVQPGRTDEAVRLGELAMRGGFARGRVAISF
jgi:hypothetical protein